MDISEPFANKSSIILQYSYCEGNIKRRWLSVSFSQQTQRTRSVAASTPSSFSAKSIDEEVGGGVIYYFFFNLMICRDYSVWSCHFLTCVTYLKLLGWYFFFLSVHSTIFTWFKKKKFPSHQMVSCLFELPHN